MKTKYLVAAIAGGLLSFAPLTSFAATRTWSNTGTDYNAGGSWGGTAPGTGDNATFTGAAGAFQPSLTASIQNQGLTFSTAASSGYTLSSGAGSLTLTNIGTTTSSAINAANTSGTNTISASIILGGAAATTATFTQAAGGTLAISGNISSTNAITGLALTGAGVTSVFTLSGSNTYSGNTTLTTGGLLKIQSANAFSAGALVVGANFSIDNTTGASMALANNNNINLNGGVLTFVGTNDLSFGTGVVTLGGNRGIATTAGTLTIASIDAGLTSQTFAKTGAGTLAITGAAGATFQGGFSNATGTVLIGNKSSLGTGLLTMSSGTLAASADLSGSNAVANNILLGGNTTIGGANNLTLSGTVTQNSGRTLTNSNTGATVLSGPIYLSDVSGTGYTLTLAGAQNLTVSGAIANFNGVGTAGNVTSSNTGTVSLTSANSSYTGITTALGTTGSVLAVSKLANGGANSSIGASSSAAANLILPNNSTLRYIGTGDSTDRLFTINGGNNGHGATLDASGGGAIQFTNTGNLAYGTNNQTRYLALTGTNTGNNSLGFALNNNGTGALSITKNGIGTWVLSGTNTYTGTNTINDGTLQFAKQVSLYNNTPASWTITNIIVKPGATAAFNVGGSGEFTSSDIGLIQALGSPTTGFNNGTFIGLDTTNASGGTFTYGTVIANTNGGANSVGLKKLGARTLELTAANTYTGATTVVGGTLLISSGNINSSSVAVSAGAELKYNSSTARTGTVTLNGNGVLNRAILSGTGTINTAVTLDNLGDTLSPGNSPGIQPFAVGQTWNSLTYLWETNNFAGTTPGTDFDQITIAGGLILSGGVNSYFLDINSLTAGNVAGLVSGFSETNTLWTILTASGGITGFDAANWTIGTSNFTSSPAWTGTWSLAQSGNNLVLSYTVVPEPSTVMLLGLGACFTLFGYRRRRQ